MLQNDKEKNSESHEKITNGGKVTLSLNTVVKTKRVKSNWNGLGLLGP